MNLVFNMFEVGNKNTQLTFTCSKSTVETEKYVKYVQI